MIVWLNGAFGAGKTTAAYELHRRLEHSFVYDPENVGYFLRKNMPQACCTDDFQDMVLWRSFNYRVLKEIDTAYGGTVIVPMTLVEPAVREIGEVCGLSLLPDNRSRIGREADRLKTMIRHIRR